MFRRLTRLLFCAALLLTWPLVTSAQPAPAREGETHTTTAAPAAEKVESAAREHEVIEFDAATAIWVLIIFTVLLAVLYPTAWKNVLAGLKAREEKIRKDIADAEAARAKAEATLRQYTTQLATAEDRVRQMINQAAAEGEKLATSIRMKAQSEAEEIKERATKDIEAARDGALREIYEKTAELATTVAEKIIRRSLNAADQQDLVRQGLEQLQNVK